ncbi:MAG TPA: ribosome recycling factor, partial [Pontiella sp.]|nr:ribosome recycling factor [Pontiella sp.]
KMAGRITEEQRISVRNIRRDSNEQIKALQKNGDITEDDRDAALDKIQKFTDDHIKKMDDMLATKEKDIMEV